LGALASVLGSALRCTGLASRKAQPGSVLLVLAHAAEVGVVEGCRELESVADGSIHAGMGDRDGAEDLERGAARGEADREQAEPEGPVVDEVVGECPDTRVAQILDNLAIRGLSVKDFHLFEDGQQQTVPDRSADAFQSARSGGIARHRLPNVFPRVKRACRSIQFSGNIPQLQGGSST
jgi:hypothetical protein